MQLENFRNQKLKELHKNCSDQLKFIENISSKASYKLSSAVEISTSDQADFEQIARDLMPWRKGPFKLNKLFIDSEWQSFMKYDLISPHLLIEGKSVLDIGCNNGYYMFRMLEKNPKSITGFDPSIIFYLQFRLINQLIRSEINYELLGVEHLVEYGKKFDFVLALGILYHRIDPIATLKTIAQSAEKDATLIIDSFIIDSDQEMVLSPKDRYSKIPNVWFVPSVPALTNWLNRTGFVDVELIDIVPTKADEQRKTEWIFGESLDSFLDPADPSLTVEGYPAPKRAYIKARRR